MVINNYKLKDQIFKLHPAVPTPGVVHNPTRGPVSVIEDGGSIQQNISWQPPVSGDVMMYVIRYGMGVSIVQDTSFNVTTPNTSILLTLSVPDTPLNMVVYNIWVAVVTKSKEQGNATELTIKYSSELQLVTITVTTAVSHFTLFKYLIPIILYISVEVAWVPVL